MQGKVTIDLNQRTVGRYRLLWNKLTPTRGARIVKNTLADFSSKGPVKISIGDKFPRKSAIMTQIGLRNIVEIQPPVRR